MKLYGFKDPYSKRWVFDELQSKYTTHEIEDFNIKISAPFICKHREVTPCFNKNNGFVCKGCDIEMLPITFIPVHEKEDENK